MSSADQTKSLSRYSITMPLLLVSPNPPTNVYGAKLSIQANTQAEYILPETRAGMTPEAITTGRLNNHDIMYQYCIPNIANPFIQEAGQTYWLMIKMNINGCYWGWNSAQSVNGSSAVFWDNNTSEWAQLMTPVTQTPLDLAFVLAPEPTTLMLPPSAACFCGKYCN